MPRKQPTRVRGQGPYLAELPVDIAGPYTHVVVRDGGSGKEFGRSVRGVMVREVGIPAPSSRRSVGPFQ